MPPPISNGVHMAFHAQYLLPAAESSKRTVYSMAVGYCLIRSSGNRWTNIPTSTHDAGTLTHCTHSDSSYCALFMRSHRFLFHFYHVYSESIDVDFEAIAFHSLTQQIGSPLWKDNLREYLSTPTMQQEKDPNQIFMFLVERNVSVSITYTRFDYNKGFHLHDAHVWYIRRQSFTSIYGQFVFSWKQ